MKRQQNTAILFFSRSVRGESLAKKYLSDDSVNFSIAKYLILKAKKRLEQTPFHVYQIDEHCQRGSSFGEKLSNAFKEIFDKGYDYVIAVGNDCARLHFDYHYISSCVKHKKAIIGPDKRGGVYMLGISKDTDYGTIFNSISWKSQEVFLSLKESLGHSVILNQLNDINTQEDIFINDDLLKIAKGLVINIIQLFWIEKYCPIRQLVSILLRGPPAIANNL